MHSFANSNINKKKSYRKKALKFHPDKLEKTDDKAGKMFQKILCAYNILKDKAKREIYDKTGEVSDKDPTSIEQFVQAYQYYRSEFPELREQDIESFEGKYRQSKEEETDLLEFLTDNKGDVTYLLHNIILSRNEDVPRFLEFFAKVIKSEEHKAELQPLTKTFLRTKKKIKKLSSREAKEAKQMKHDRMASLRQAILLRRSTQSNSFLDNLENAFTEFPDGRENGVLKDNKKVTNQGKRQSPGHIKSKKKKGKGRKKVNSSIKSS